MLNDSDSGEGLPCTRPARGIEDPREAALWTVAEVAAYLKVHPKSIYDLAGRGKLPCVRIGCRLRFIPSDLHRWVSARKEG